MGNTSKSNMMNISNNTDMNIDQSTTIITVKVSRSDDIRRFEVNALDLNSIAARVIAMWPELSTPQLTMAMTRSPQLTYIDDEGDNVTLATDADLREALQVLKQMSSTTLRLTVADDAELRPDFLSLGKGKGKGKGGKGKGFGKGKCKGKGFKGQQIAAALNISVEDARELIHKAHDGDEEARGQIREFRASLADAVGIDQAEAQELIERAHNGDDEARQQLKEFWRGLQRSKGHGKYHCKGKGRGKGKGKWIAAAAGISVDEARDLMDHACDGDAEARKKLHDIRKRCSGKLGSMHKMGKRLGGAVRAAFSRMRPETDSDDY